MNGKERKKNGQIEFDSEAMLQIPFKPFRLEEAKYW